MKLKTKIKLWIGYLCTTGGLFYAKGIKFGARDGIIIAQMVAAIGIGIIGDTFITVLSGLEEPENLEEGKEDETEEGE